MTLFIIYLKCMLTVIYEIHNPSTFMSILFHANVNAKIILKISIRLLIPGSFNQNNETQKNPTHTVLAQTEYACILYA